MAKERGAANQDQVDYHPTMSAFWGLESHLADLG